MEAIGLNLLIFVPLLGAILVWTLPEQRTDMVRRTALWIGMAVMVIALLLWVRVLQSGPSALVGEFSQNWIAAGDPASGDLTGHPSAVRIRYHVGLDAISGVLTALTGLLIPLSIACSFASIRRREHEYYAWLLLLTAGMFGVFAARDVLLFYIFFEFTLIPLYFLIGIWGGAERRAAANMFFLYTFVGSVITFAGILYLAVRAAVLTHSSTIEFDLLKLSMLNGLSATEQSLLFLAFFAGFAIKVPFFPVHTWLPLAHTEAPTAGSVLLAGVLLKLGTYGFLRFSLPMVPEGALAWSGVMGGLAVAGIIYGALVSWVQQDVKKLVAYSSVSHLGFCMLGMFSFLPVGLSGSVLYMVNHGINTGALFLVVGMIYDRYHTRDMEKIGGLARQMPIMAFFLVFFVLASIGLPGLNGFVSEFTVLFAAFNSTHVLGPWYGSLGAIGILLGAVYLLYMTGKVLFGPLREPDHTPDLAHVRSRDLNGREIGILLPLAVAALALGVYPRVITDPLEPLLDAQIMRRIEGPVAVRQIAAEGEAAQAAELVMSGRPGVTNVAVGTNDKSNSRFATLGSHGDVRP